MYIVNVIAILHSILVARKIEKKNVKSGSKNTIDLCKALVIKSQDKHQ